MVPTVPLSVWEQISVVIVFAFLLGGMGWFLVKMFSKAIAEINAHYATIVTNNNSQWQKYFDARGEIDKIVSEQIVKQLEGLTKIVGRLVSDFEKHDQMERQALDEMAGKKTLAKKTHRNT
jgi:predicted PurR-regulated permease PerM